jgi:hypothetical protein
MSYCPLAAHARPCTPGRDQGTNIEGPDRGWRDQGVREIQRRSDARRANADELQGNLAENFAAMPFPRAAAYAALTRFLRVMLTTRAGAICHLGCVLA